MSKQAELESAIPQHLRQPGNCPFRGRTKALPYPTYVARFPATVSQVVICYLGIQTLGQESMPAFQTANHALVSLLGLPDGPQYWDQSTFIDRAGFTNHLFALYWRNPARYDRWTECGNVADWWESRERETDGIGYFKEVFTPRSSHLETHYATREPQALGNLGDRMSGEIIEHAYWGAMRDRIPASQTDTLSPVGRPLITNKPGNEKRRVIIPHENLCIIRSGQDWENADQQEIDLYKEVILPQLSQGMHFLNQNGLDIGCLGNRFVNIIDSNGAIRKQSYGLSYWTGLDALEKWAATHETHLRIFGAAQAYMGKLGSAAKLTTYHEVAVMTAREQSFEYVNCHAYTGMLNLGHRSP